MMREETLEEARERMIRLLSSGTGDIGLEQMSFSLKDPLTCMRMAIPARFDDASGAQAFDLDSFLSLVEENRKWQDPTTLKNSTIKQLRVDSYVREIAKAADAFPSLCNFEVNAEGDWRPERYEDGWFDVRKSATAEVKSAIEAFVKNSAQEDSLSGDETLDLGGVREENIDQEHEELEAMSALLSVGHELAVQRKQGHIQNGGYVGTGGAVQSIAPLRAGKKRPPPVEVIDLCDDSE